LFFGICLVITLLFSLGFIGAFGWSASEAKCGDGVVQSILGELCDLGMPGDELLNPPWPDFASHLCKKPSPFSSDPCKNVEHSECEWNDVNKDGIQQGNEVDCDCQGDYIPDNAHEICECPDSMHSVSDESDDCICSDCPEGADNCVDEIEGVNAGVHYCDCPANSQENSGGGCVCNSGFFDVDGQCEEIKITNLYTWGHIAGLSDKGNAEYNKQRGETPTIVEWYFLPEGFSFLGGTISPEGIITIPQYGQISSEFSDLIVKGEGNFDPAQPLKYKLIYWEALNPTIKQGVIITNGTSFNITIFKAGETLWTAMQFGTILEFEVYTSDDTFLGRTLFFTEHNIPVLYRYKRGGASYYDPYVFYPIMTLFKGASFSNPDFSGFVDYLRDYESYFSNPTFINTLYDIGKKYYPYMNTWVRRSMGRPLHQSEAYLIHYHNPLIERIYIDKPYPDQIPIANYGTYDISHFLVALDAEESVFALGQLYEDIFSNDI
jgi:hypothetical protein